FVLCCGRRAGFFLAMFLLSVTYNASVTLPIQAKRFRALVSVQNRSSGPRLIARYISLCLHHMPDSPRAKKSDDRAHKIALGDVGLGDEQRHHAECARNQVEQEHSFALAESALHQPVAKMVLASGEGMHPTPQARNCD